MSKIDHSVSQPTWQQSVYEQLHVIAKRAMEREPAGHSLQPTMLVNDAYLRLLEQNNVNRDDRSQVLAVGANIIRRMLVDYARKRRAEKRGGEGGRGFQLHVSLPGNAKVIDIVELNDVMEKLAQKHERTAQVVELKFFGGMSSEEIADHLSVSVKTVKNDWRFAKAWLYRQLGDAWRQEGEL